MTHAMTTRRSGKEPWDVIASIDGRPDPASSLPAIPGAEHGCASAAGTGDTPEAAEKAACANLRAFLAAALAEIDK